MKKISLILSIIVLLSIPSFSRLLENALKDGIGVRPMGMGGAFTAISDDANGIFYNPAGFGHKRFEYLRGYLDVNKTIYEGGDYSILAIKDLCFANWYLKDENLDRVDVVAISYTNKTRGIDYGVTIKNVYGSTTMEEIAGYSFDLGLKGKFGGMFWGVNVQDIHEVNLDIPASVRAGVGFNFGPSILVIEGEGRNLKDKDKYNVISHVGVEAELTKGLLGRIGYDDNYSTAGFTVSVPVVDIDYAIAIKKESSENDSIQRIGFKFKTR